MTKVELKSGHHTVLFELTPDGLHVFATCCGARVSRPEAKALRRLLKAYLTQS